MIKMLFPAAYEKLLALNKVVFLILIEKTHNKAFPFLVSAHILVN